MLHSSIFFQSPMKQHQALTAAVLVAVAWIGIVGGGTFCVGKHPETNSALLADEALETEGTPSTDARRTDLEASSGQSVARESADASPGVAATAPGADVVEDPHARMERMQARMEAWSESEKWEEIYGAMTADQLDAVRTDIHSKITDGAKEELERRFSAGEVQVFSTGTTYTAEPFNPYDVYWVRIPQGGPVMKATLPEAGFEEVYKWKSLSEWLAQKGRSKTDR